MKILFIFLLLSAFFLTGCDLFNTDTKKPSGELVPLAVGNYWKYESTYLDVIRDTIRYEVTAKVEVPIGDTSYTAYAANFVPFPPDLEPYYWLRRNGEQGLYSMGGVSGADTLFINEVEYKLPSEVGETIETPQISYSFDRFEFYISDTLSITLIDDDREIFTPAGKFECFVYNFILSAGDDVEERFDYYLFYSLGIGLVKQEERGKSSQNIKSELILIKYQLQ
ncbi:MAG: hypothetical protein JJ892_06515 [Balneola sp.]|nr:hypothetical protein [Balneola sp.]MBO6649929.1 hypothetical protein [Balneola sp.]MBO6711723.1 hypothetical protein [Balneola sp.]MBO6799917.1 hypothetical protein [Balneola sp.]MBO6871162.1 hypothetical protein [Balneola sp.]